MQGSFCSITFLQKEKIYYVDGKEKRKLRMRKKEKIHMFKNHKMSSDSGVQIFTIFPVLVRCNGCC